MNTRKLLVRSLNLLVVFAMIFASPMSAFAAVWTDQQDYRPGSVVTISGDNSDSAGYLPGETVHVDVLGPNEYAEACEGVADADGAWSCQVTLWDSPQAVGTYSYTATGLQSLVAQSGLFMDSAGDFSLDLAAAAPYSYNHLTGGGAFDDGTIGKHADVVESLEAVDFACGDIVTFFTKVTVDDTTSAAADAPQTIELDYEFLMDTTGQPGVAIGDIVYVGVNYGTIEDLIAGENTTDDGNIDDGGSVATLISETQTAPMFSKGAKLQGTIQVTDLERAESVIVRIDTKLFCDIGANPTGNLQTDLTAARLTYIKGDVPVTPPANISAGNQTIPFYQFGALNAPQIDIQKTVTTADGACPGGETLSIYAGATVKYCYVVSNDGTAPLYNVTLMDDNGTPSNPGDDFLVTLTGLTDVDGDGSLDDLPAGGDAYGFASVTLTSVGTVVNTATATGYDAITYPTEYTDTDTASVVVQPPPVVAPQPRVVKGGEEGNDTVATLDEPGGSVTINVVVYNDAPAGTGDAALTSLTDDIYGDITTTGHNGITATTCGTGGIIASGGSYSCSFTVDITSEPATIIDKLTAILTNTHSSVSDDDQANVVISNVEPTVDLVKDVTPASLAEPGGAFSYTLTITNTSDEPVTVTALTDDNPLPTECTDLLGQSIAAGESLTCTYSVTHADPGTYPNTASVTVQDNDGSTASDSDAETVTVTNVAPTITVDKSANPTSLPEPGGMVTFTVVVTNNSFEPVTLTSLTDNVYGDLNGQGSCATGGEIAAGDSYTCSFEGAVSGNPGLYTDTVTAVATDNDGTTDTETDDATVELTDVAPVIRITKTADPTSVPETGGDVAFTFLVENIGQEDVTLTSLTDTVFGDLDGKGTCDVPQTILVGGSYSCEYVVFLASDSLTDHFNVVTATAVDNDGTEATDDDDETVTFEDLAPEIRITKTASPTSVPETGGDVTFTFLVENIGVEDITLTSLTDTMFGDLNGQGDCVTGGIIAVGGSYSCSITEFLASDNLTNHTNVVTAVGTDDDGTTDEATDDETVTFENVAPAIRITKSASPTHVPETGGDVTFTFLVENTGQEDVTLTGLTDTVFGDLNGQGDCVTGGTIAVGGSYSCSITKFLASDSLASHYNVSTATAEDNDGTPATDDDDETVTFDDVAPAIRITKTADPTHVPETGGDVTFTFLVENIGQEDVTLTSLTDTVFGDLNGKGTCAVPQTILIGGSYSCEYTIFLASDELTNHDNVVTASAVDDDDTPATDDDNETVTFDDVAPVIRMTKTANPASVPETGGDVTFTFLVENIGQEDVTLTTLSDTVFGNLDGEGTCDVPQVILIGGSYSCTITKFLSSDSLTNHSNVASATAVDDDDTPASDDDDETVTFEDVLPDISVTKTADPTAVPETGGNVTFTFVVTNNAPEAATITSLEDSVYGTLQGDADCMVGTILGSGASCDFTLTKWVEGDYSAADHTNVFTAKAADNDGNEDTAADEAVVDFTNVLPTIEVTKTADPTVVPETGGDVVFTFVVKNTSSEEPVTITSLEDSIYGELVGDADCMVGTILAAGASCEFSITKTVAGDYSGADHVNVFTAHAEDNDGTDASDDDNATVDFTDVLPDIAVVKTANPISVPEPGADVTFTFTVTNNGTEAVTIFSLNDSVFGALAGDADCMVGTVLAAGASCDFSILQKISGNASFVHKNEFTAVAKDNDGNPDTATDDATVTVTDVLPSIQVDKTANKTSIIFTGDVVTYTIKVTNTSVEPVTLYALLDDKFGDLQQGTQNTRTWLTSTCNLPQTLAVGASYTCAITAKISAALDPFKTASHTNTVTGTAKDDEGNPAVDTGTATVTFYWRGRTPGYWKNHPKGWPKNFTIVNYKGQTITITTSTLVLSVFDMPKSLQTCTATSCILDLNGDKKNDTLIQALAYQGGETLAGKAQILLRAATAALLNEKTFGVAYPPYNSVADLIIAVNATLATLNEQAYIALSNKLDWWNNGVE